MQSGRLIVPREPLDRIPADSGGGFYFIANILDVELTLPVAITSSIQLDRADSTQIAVIQRSLEKSEDFGLPTMRRSYYECDWVPVQTGHRSEPISEDKWRYYILSFSGHGNDVHQLLKITFLVPPYISAFASFRTTSPFGCGVLFGKGLNPFESQSFYFSQIEAKSQALTMDDIRNVQETLELYKRLDPTRHEGIIRALEFHHTVVRLNQTGRLSVLAYFVIIEMLLTHNPNAKEVGDSISHQLKTKLSFISERLSTKFNYGLFASDVSQDKIWGLLYSYRSSIAHGDHFEFKNLFKILKDEGTVLDFLASATRILLKHALREPDLINGLKPI